MTRREVVSAADLRAVRRLSFFLSAERIGVSMTEASMGTAKIAQRRLDTLQSVCGCIPATIALAIGAGFGCWSKAPVYAICAYGIGAAVVAKFSTISLAYFAYRNYLDRLCRRVGAARRPVLDQ